MSLHPAIQGHVKLWLEQGNNDSDIADALHDEYWVRFFTERGASYEDVLYAKRKFTPGSNRVLKEGDHVIVEHDGFLIGRCVVRVTQAYDDGSFLATVVTGKAHYNPTDARGFPFSASDVVRGEVIQEVDPDLERLLMEEEEIERRTRLEVET